MGTPTHGPEAPDARVPFRVFRSFNEERLRWAARSTFKLDRKSVASFTGDPFAMKIIARLGEERAISIKEVLESFETFSRVRRRVRAPVMADLCCGHGLTGLLFAAIERTVERVILLDYVEHPKAARIDRALFEVAPWAEAKVERRVADVADAAEHLPDGCSVVAVHACGVRTDRALEAAVAVRGKVAVMPCCYAQTGKRAPRALRDALGAQLATDIERTYVLRDAGYRVEWSKIPEAITPMNRVLLGQPS